MTFRRQHGSSSVGRAGRKTLFAWVVEMDDPTAYMELVLANTQSELSPIEIGMHALGCPTAQGVTGAGIQMYADRVGRTQRYVTEVRNAAEVLRDLNLFSQANKFADKAKHLNEIHKLSAELWRPFVKLIHRFGWSKDRTGEVTMGGTNRVRGELCPP